MVDGCRGDFLPDARAMIVSGTIHRGLYTIAKHGAFDISLESVVQQKPWRGMFARPELDAAAWRLRRVQELVDNNLPPDTDDE